MSKTLRMSFTTAAGSTHSMTVKNPKAGLTAAEVTASMDLLIAKNIFLTTGGDLKAKKDAVVTDATVTDLYTPPDCLIKCWRSSTGKNIRKNIRRNIRHLFLEGWRRASVLSFFYL